MAKFLTAAFYKFVTLDDFEALREPILEHCRQRDVYGTILLAPEGINGTIAGDMDAVRGVLQSLRQDPRLADLEHKEAHASSPPFHRLKVRLKREIVALRVPGVDADKQAGTYVRPEDWNALIRDPDVVVIDTRNDYEVEVGSFAGAIDPKTQSFSDLPAWLGSREDLNPDTPVAMFCTGGIRCEKSTAYLRAAGFEKVYHLQGGILKYLETVPAEESLWQGECFVFDERVSVGHGLTRGTHSLCRACRRPVSAADRESVHFVEGVSCPDCFDKTSDEQKRGFTERQRQVQLARARQQMHIGAKANKNGND